MHPCIIPYRQGDLDSLCGVYAIINAFRALCPELTRPACAELFRSILMSVETGLGEPVDASWNGLETQKLTRALAFAIRYLAGMHDIAVRAKPLQFRKPKTIDRLWSTLKAETDAGQVAIILLTGIDDHWTVVNAVTEKSLCLLDSSGRHRIPRSRCTLARTTSRHRLTPDVMLLLKRRPSD